MLCSFLNCRERFRLKVIEGLQPADRFEHRIEYGQMWHSCEESYAKNPKGGYHSGSPFHVVLQQYSQGLCRKYPLQQNEIDKWYWVCKTQFPLYVEHWAQHPDVKDRTPLLQEYSFRTPFQLPSNRVVYLRGKFDSVDSIGKEGIYLQENKTQGEINEESLQRQLRSGYNLQTGLYMSALHAVPMKSSVRGIRYNVVRRPLSGGKHSIRQLEPTKSNPRGESHEEFYARLGKRIKEDADYFFMRWKIEFTMDDVYRFQQRCLIPILENLCEWYDWVARCFQDKHCDMYSNPVHSVFPYGVYSSLKEGYETEMDAYLINGSEVGLQRVDSLFREL
jgi:hypothetical protein